MGLVETVRNFHTSQELSLVSSPVEFIGCSDLSEQFAVVGVVETKPSVIVLEHSQDLGFIEVDGLSSINAVSAVHVECVLRGFSQARDEVVTPLSNGVSRCGVSGIADQRVLSHKTRSPLE